MDDEELYPCVGVCLNDPLTGICQGCGRPPISAEAPAGQDQAGLEAEAAAGGAKR